MEAEATIKANKNESSKDELKEQPKDDNKDEAIKDEIELQPFKTNEAIKDEFKKDKNKPKKNKNKKQKKKQNKTIDYYEGLRIIVRVVFNDHKFESTKDNQNYTYDSKVEKKFYDNYNRFEDVQIDLKVRLYHKYVWNDFKNTYLKNITNNNIKTRYNEILSTILTERGSINDEYKDELEKMTLKIIPIIGCKFFMRLTQIDRKKNIGCSWTNISNIFLGAFDKNCYNTMSEINVFNPANAIVNFVNAMSDLYIVELSKDTNDTLSNVQRATIEVQLNDNPDINKLIFSKEPLIHCAFCLIDNLPSNVYKGEGLLYQLKTFILKNSKSGLLESELKLIFEHNFPFLYPEDFAMFIRTEINQNVIFNMIYKYFNLNINFTDDELRYLKVSIERYVYIKLNNILHPIQIELPNKEKIDIEHNAENETNETNKNEASEDETELKPFNPNETNNDNNKLADNLLNPINNKVESQNDNENEEEELDESNDINVLNARYLKLEHKINEAEKFHINECYISLQKVLDILAEPTNYVAISTDYFNRYAYIPIPIIANRKSDVIFTEELIEDYGNMYNNNKFVYNVIYMLISDYSFLSDWNRYYKTNKQNEIDIKRIHKRINLYKQTVKSYIEIFTLNDFDDDFEGGSLKCSTNKAFKNDLEYFNKNDVSKDSSTNNYKSSTNNDKLKGGFEGFDKENEDDINEEEDEDVLKTLSKNIRSFEIIEKNRLKKLISNFRSADWIIKISKMDITIDEFIKTYQNNRFKRLNKENYITKQIPYIRNYDDLTSDCISYKYFFEGSTSEVSKDKTKDVFNDASNNETETKEDIFDRIPSYERLRYFMNEDGMYHFFIPIINNTINLYRLELINSKTLLSKSEAKIIEDINNNILYSRIYIPKHIKRWHFVVLASLLATSNKNYLTFTDILKFSNALDIFQNNLEFFNIDNKDLSCLTSIVIGRRLRNTNGYIYQIVPKIYFNDFISECCANFKIIEAPIMPLGLIRWMLPNYTKEDCINMIFKNESEDSYYYVLDTATDIFQYNDSILFQNVVVNEYTNRLSYEKFTKVLEDSKKCDINVNLLVSQYGVDYVNMYLEIRSIHGNIAESIKKRFLPIFSILSIANDINKHFANIDNETIYEKVNKIDYNSIISKHETSFYENIGKICKNNEQVYIGYAIEIFSNAFNDLNLNYHCLDYDFYGILKVIIDKCKGDYFIKQIFIDLVNQYDVTKYVTYKIKICDVVKNISKFIDYSLFSSESLVYVICTLFRNYIFEDWIKPYKDFYYNFPKTTLDKNIKVINIKTILSKSKLEKLDSYYSSINDRSNASINKKTYLSQLFGSNQISMLLSSYYKTIKKFFKYDINEIYKNIYDEYSFDKHFIATESLNSEQPLSDNKAEPIKVNKEQPIKEPTKEQPSSDIKDKSIEANKEQSKDKPQKSKKFTLTIIKKDNTQFNPDDIKPKITVEKPIKKINVEKPKINVESANKNKIEFKTDISTKEKEIEDTKNEYNRILNKNKIEYQSKINSLNKKPSNDITKITTEIDYKTYKLTDKDANKAMKEYKDKSIGDIEKDIKTNSKKKIDSKTILIVNKLKYMLAYKKAQKEAPKTTTEETPKLSDNKKQELIEKYTNEYNETIKNVDKQYQTKLERLEDELNELKAQNSEYSIAKKILNELYRCIFATITDRFEKTYQRTVIHVRYIDGTMIPKELITVANQIGLDIRNNEVQVYRILSCFRSYLENEGLNKDTAQLDKLLFIMNDIKYQNLNDKLFKALILTMCTCY